MKKIYLLPEKVEINLGDVLSINGFRVTVTQAFIDANPQNFLIKDVKKKVGEISENSIPEFVKAKLAATSTVKGRIYRTLPSTKPNQYRWLDEVSEDAVRSLDGFKSLFSASTKEAWKKQMIEDAKIKYPVGTFAKSAAIGKIYEVRTSDFMWDGMGDLINGTQQKGFTVYHNGNWAKPVTLAEAIKGNTPISSGNSFVLEAIAIAKNKKLVEAKAKFPIGSHFTSMLTGEHCIINTSNFYWGGGQYAEHICVGSPLGHSVFDGHNWATKLKPLFVTFDNVPIYNGERSVCVNRKTFAISESLPFRGDAQGDNWYFSTAVAAQEFVKRNKPKVLADYEAQLLKDENEVHKTTSLIKGVIIAIRACKYYEIMKVTDPKQYWSKVLQLIANDLNEGWKPNWSGRDTEVKYSIMYNYNNKKVEVDTVFRYDTGKVVFVSEKAATRAISIIGDKFMEIVK